MSFQYILLKVSCILFFHFMAVTFSLEQNKPLTTVSYSIFRFISLLGEWVINLAPQFFSQNIILNAKEKLTTTYDIVHHSINSPM